MVLAEREVRDRPRDVDAVGGSRGEEGERRCAERARVEDPAPPALSLATPEDRVRAALREALDHADRPVRPEHRRGSRWDDARGEALLGDPGARELPGRGEADEVERRAVVRFVERVGDRGPPGRIERETGDAEQGSLRGVRDDEGAPAAGRADDEADPGPAGLDEDGVRREPDDASLGRRKRRDRARPPGAVPGRNDESPAFDPRDPRRPVTRDRERAFRDPRRDDLRLGRARQEQREPEEGDEALHGDTVAVSSRLDIITLIVRRPGVGRSRPEVAGLDTRGMRNRAIGRGCRRRR